MIRVIVLLFCLLIDHAWGMDFVSVADRVIALNSYHRNYVSGVFVLPKEILKKEEMEDVWASLDKDFLSYPDKDKGKKFLRRNLLGVADFLKRSNPKFSYACQTVTNLLVLDAYTSLTIAQPIFSNVDQIQQHAILYLANDIDGRGFFSPAGDDRERFLKDNSEWNGTLVDALGSFMERNGYKSETVRMTLFTEKTFCAEHMLDHFVNTDDYPGKKFSGYFVTSKFQDMATNKKIAEAIIDALFESKMARMIISPDRYEPGALILRIRLRHDEVPGLGRVLAETPVVAFSSSAKGDIFFPTDWIKAVIVFKRSATGVLKISLVSVYPDAIGLPQTEALNFQKS